MPISPRRLFVPPPGAAFMVTPVSEVKPLPKTSPLLGELEDDQVILDASCKDCGRFGVVNTAGLCLKCEELAESRRFAIRSHSK